MAREWVCVPKTRSGRTDDEVRREWDVTAGCQCAELGDARVRFCSETSASERHYSRGCLRDLAGNPIGRWAVRHGNVDQLAAIQSNDDESIKQVEGKRRDHG